MELWGDLYMSTGTKTELTDSNTWERDGLLFTVKGTWHRFPLCCRGKAPSSRLLNANHNAETNHRAITTSSTDQGSGQTTQHNTFAEAGFPTNCTVLVAILTLLQNQQRFHFLWGPVLSQCPLSPNHCLTPHVWMKHYSSLNAWDLTFCGVNFC